MISKKTKKFIIITVIFIVGVLFLQFLFNFNNKTGGIFNHTEYLDLKKELSAASSGLPVNYSMQGEEYSPSGLDNSASMKFTYNVSGTREEVFQNVVKSLGLNPDEHKESYDQNLNGVGSPKYKYLYFLNISPSDDVIVNNDPCLANGEDDLQWKICKNKDPKRGKNIQATTMELEVIKR